MTIEQQIREFIQRELYFAEDNLLKDDASFLETGVVDSMGVMELVAFVQSQFGLSVPPEDLVVANFDSVTKLAGYIRRKLSLPNPTVPDENVTALSSSCFSTAGSGR